MIWSPACVHILPALTDNYIYLVEWPNKTAWVVDPGESQTVEECLALSGLSLEHVFLTHHHNDHIGGVSELKRKHNPKIWGPRHAMLPFVDEVVNSGLLRPQSTAIDFELEAFRTPGHTKSSICFTLQTKDNSWLFSGDTLFSHSCGRLFEGSPDQMLKSLNLIKNLSPEFLLCCGHEYTRKNLHFSIETLNWKRPQLEKKLQSLKEPSLPVALEEELQLNPFLNCNDPELKKGIGLNESASELETFVKIRRLRDQY